LTALALVFWVAAALVVYTHVGYPAVLLLLDRMRARRESAAGTAAEGAGGTAAEQPPVTLVIAAHNEEDTIEEKLDNARSLAYGDLREIIVASDGSDDRTDERVRLAAARDVRVRLLSLPRSGKSRAQDAGVEAATGEVVAFSDANVRWEPGALGSLVRSFADPRVGYVCGRLCYADEGGTNEEGVYWRLETATRALESRLGSITAGNGGIYAVRRQAYRDVDPDPRTSHDLSMPFNLVKRGWRAKYEPSAVAVERPLPSVESEFRRKRRMMAHAWPTIIAGGMLDLRGYGPLYGFEIISHRLLRYATPLLHVVALAANAALLSRGGVYVATFAAQVALLAGALLSPLFGGRLRPLSLCRYYVLVTTSIAAGLFDWLRRGTPATWERAEGRR
jgi:glycosyltransferase involved in cell wall biosynthesis